MDNNQAACIDGASGGTYATPELTLEGFAGGFAQGVEDRIRAQGLDPHRVPDITEYFDLAGGASWRPVRPADFDASAWGAWECWEHCKIGTLPNGAVGAMPSGDWVAWDSASGRMFGFASRKAAEMMAVLQNENAPTRVVHFDGSFEASSMSFDDVHTQVETQMQREADAAEAASQN